MERIFARLDLWGRGGGCGSIRQTNNLGKNGENPVGAHLKTDGWGRFQRGIEDLRRKDSELTSSPKKDLRYHY